MWYIENMDPGKQSTWKNDMKYLLYVLLFVIAVMIFNGVVTSLLPFEPVVFHSGWRYELDQFFIRIWNAIF